MASTDHVINRYDLQRFMGRNDNTLTYRYYNAIADTPPRRTERQELERTVIITLNPITNCFVARLFDLHIQRTAPTHLNGRQEAAIKDALIEELVTRYMELHPIEQVTLGVDLGAIEERIMATAETAVETAVEAEVEAEVEVEVEVEVNTPVFIMRQNIRDAALRELREKQPHEILVQNYQISTLRASEHHKENINGYINSVRQLQFARHIHTTITPNLQNTAKEWIGNNFSREVRSYALDQTAELHHQTAYRLAVSAITARRIFRENFKENQKEFAPIQAKYIQKAAMIRQKPSIPISINCQKIIETLTQWEMVWGVAIQHNIAEDELNIRVGLSNIIMAESAEPSAYDSAIDILLAPFYITINLTEEGQFRCLSGGRNTKGLSRSNTCGRLDYDIHPHQLSDSPCFGTFGQTLVDAANSGDIISLTSGLIAFYSQYNSRDSAGVSAQYFHPYHIESIRNKEDYKNELKENVELFSPYHTYDDLKLTAAIDKYITYHGAERNEDPPKSQSEIVCASCEEADVSDDTGYYISYHDDRICESCWNDHYCQDCERYTEDCTCEPE